MGLYNFKAQFVPKILAGEKTHTIRAIRKDGYRECPGRTLHLYTGLRQKGAQLLMRVECTKVRDITIDRDGLIAIDGIELSVDEEDRLARADGFDSYLAMMSFWVGRLPFEGQIIHWRFSK